MAAPSVAGSKAGGPGRGAAARGERAMVKALAASIKSAEQVRGTQDRDFISECLDGQDSDLVPVIAGLLRNGGLRQAMTLLDDQKHVDEKGKALGTSLTHFRKTIGVPLMYEMLKTFEPEKFKGSPDEVDTPGDELIKVICWALNINEGTPFPSIHPSLRFVRVLCLYIRLRYVDMGSRLARIDPKRALLPQCVYYKILDEPANTVELQVKVAGVDGLQRAPFPKMAHGQNWYFDKPYTLKPRLVSDEDDMDLNVFATFTKAQCKMPPEPTLEWGIDQSRWPGPMLNKTQTSGDGETESPAAKRPRGSGSARPGGCPAASAAPSAAPAAAAAAEQE